MYFSFLNYLQKKKTLFVKSNHPSDRENVEKTSEYTFFYHLHVELKNQQIS